MSSLSILPSLFTSYFSLYKESSLLLGPLLATSLISAMVTLLSPFKSKQELMVAALVASFPLPAGGVATGGLFKVPSLIFALRNPVPNPTTNFASKEFSRVASPTTRTPSPTCKSLAVTFPPFFKILLPFGMEKNLVFSFVATEIVLSGSLRAFGATFINRVVPSIATSTPVTKFLGFASFALAVAILPLEVALGVEVRGFESLGVGIWAKTSTGVIVKTKNIKMKKTALFINLEIPSRIKYF